MLNLKYSKNAIMLERENEGKEKQSFKATFKQNTVLVIYGQFLRCSTARGSSTGLSLVGPTKVKALISVVKDI